MHCVYLRLCFPTKDPSMLVRLTQPFASVTELPCEMQPRRSRFTTRWPLRSLKSAARKPVSFLARRPPSHVRPGVTTCPLQGTALVYDCIRDGSLSDWSIGKMDNLQRKSINKQTGTNQRESWRNDIPLSCQAQGSQSVQPPRAPPARVAACPTPAWDPSRFILATAGRPPPCISVHHFPPSRRTARAHWWAGGRGDRPVSLSTDS